MTPGRIMMGPVDHPSLGISFVDAQELDTVPDLERVDALGKSIL